MNVQPLSPDETDLLQTYRASCSNDQTMLCSLLQAWQALSPAHRGLVFKVADALRSATA